MLAIQGYGKEDVLLILLLLYEYENKIFRNYYFTFFPCGVKHNHVVFPPLKQDYN